MGLNPYREIVFRSTFQIAGARTVNRLFSPFSDVRKKKGLRIFRRLFHADAQNWFFVVLLRGLLWAQGCFLRSLYYPAGYEPAAGVERRGLTGAWRAHGRVKGDVQRAVRHRSRRGGVESTRVAHAHVAAEFIARRRDEPVGLAGADVVHVQAVAVGEDDLVCVGAYLAHENAPARGESEAAALAERVAVAAAVGADALAVIDERALARRAAAALYPCGEVAVADEAYLHAVGLLRLRETELRGKRAHIAFHKSAERQHEPPRLLARDEAEHVALVVRTLAAKERAGARGGVVAGGDAVYAEAVRGLAEQAELYAPVAEHAGARRRAGEVGRGEGRADLALEVSARVDHVEGQPHLRRALAGELALAGGSRGRRSARPSRRWRGASP